MNSYGTLLVQKMVGSAFMASPRSIPKDGDGEETISEARVESSCVGLKQGALMLGSDGNVGLGGIVNSFSASSRLGSWASESWLSLDTTRGSGSPGKSPFNIA